MMTKANDWLTYLKDPNSFDMDHFSQSLVDDSQEYSINPNLFFSFTPHKNQVIERINELKSRTTFNGLYYLPKSSEVISETTAKELLWRCIQVSADHSRMKRKDDEAEALIRMNVTTTNDIEKFHRLGIEKIDEQNFSFQRLHESFSKYAFDQSPIYFAVIESVLKMTMDQMVTDHILNPCINYPVSFESFFELYLGGSDFISFENEIILYVSN